LVRVWSLESGGGKFQNPKSKIQTNSKIQHRCDIATDVFAPWRLDLVSNLEFGLWNFLRSYFKKSAALSTGS
jgi:hypothetical protein